MIDQIPLKSALGRKEWFFLLFIGASSFMQSAIVALQGLLYPPEASSKSVSASVYGGVMGFYRVIIVILCPLFGVYVGKIGVRRCFLLGMLLDGLSPALFGWLHFTETYTSFLTLSFILRGIEGAGVVGIKCSTYVMVGMVFPGRMALVAALAEMMYVLGLSVGPALAAYIFDIVGFPGPFFVFGLIQVIWTIAAFIWLPELPLTEHIPLTVKETLEGFVRFLKVPSILLFILGATVTSSSTEFLTTILEPFLEQFNITTAQKGFTFFLIGPLQLLSPAWGYVLDNTSRGEIITIGAALVQILAFLTIGPISFIPLNPSIWLTDVGLLFFGLAQGALMVSCFSKIVNQAKANGIPQTRTGMTFISTCYIAAQALGGTTGAPIAGLLYDNFGFRKATIFPVATSLTLCSLVLLFICVKKPSLQTDVPSSQGVNEISPLLPSERSKYPETIY